MLEGFVSKRRDRRSALKMLQKLLTRHGSPNETVTDKLGSYRAAMRLLSLKDRHETRQYGNNQVENLHLDFRRRERAMGRFQSMAALQRFTSAHAAILNLFNHQRHVLSRTHFEQLRDQSASDWQQIGMA